MSPVRSSRLAALSLVTVTLAGAWLRLDRLDFTGISHPEIYVPGIRLPEGLSEPRERTSLAKVVTGTFSSDVHPPGYYILMLGWTKLFGTDLGRIRIPGALFGIACIPLTFWLGSLLASRFAGLLAASSLAFSGYHVFWSRAARMFSLACFLGLVSSILLVRISREERPPGWLPALYAAVTVAGLATHSFFWFLFAAQVLWTLANAAGRGSFSGLCRWQMLAAIAASPLAVSALYQSGRGNVLQGGGIVPFFQDYLQFAFLLPSSLSGHFAQEPWFWHSGFWGTAARTALLFASLGLLVAGLRQSGPPPELPMGGGRGPTARHWGIAALLAAPAILLFAALASGYGVANPRLRLTAALAVLPPFLMGIAWWCERSWKRLSPLLWNPLAGPNGLLRILAILPFLLLAAISVWRPLLNQRGLLLLAPFLLVALFAGIERVARARLAWIALLAVLAPIHIFSLSSYRGMTIDPIDYRAVAGVMTPRLRQYDRILLQKRWNVTPILYYLDAGKVQLRESRSSELCRREGAARVWTIAIGSDAAPAEASPGPSGYRATERLEHRGSRMVLYEPHEAAPTLNAIAR